MSGRSKDPIHRYQRDDIENMANRLVALGFTHTWAGEQSRYVLALIDDANQRLAQLDAVWQAVERHDAGEFDPDKVDQAIKTSEPGDLRPPPV